jgi:hypothetical protein
VLLVDGHLTCLELRDAPGIDIRADDVVASLGKTCSRYETYVTATDHREIQGVSPKILKSVHFD